MGSAFPFDVHSLSDSLSEIFEDGIGDIFSFFIHSIQPQRFSSSISLVRDALLYVCGVEGGTQVGCSSPLGFLSPGNGTPGDLAKDVTDKIYIF